MRPCRNGDHQALFYPYRRARCDLERAGVGYIFRQISGSELEPFVRVQPAINRADHAFAELPAQKQAYSMFADDRHRLTTWTVGKYRRNSESVV